MTYEEALKYAREAPFCYGCMEDFVEMSSEEAEKTCHECEHRQFFDIVIETLEEANRMVHCKECKYFTHPSESGVVGTCNYTGMLVNKELGYCSYGRRKEK